MMREEEKKPQRVKLRLNVSKIVKELLEENKLYIMSHE
jgi:hypothetical protein